jgi:hypothetical protein
VGDAERTLTSISDLTAALIGFFAVSFKAFLLRPDGAFLASAPRKNSIRVFLMLYPVFTDQNRDFP